MKMKPSFASLLALLVATAPLLSAGEVERLRALVAEQEMQIQQLELKVAQLTNSPTPVTPTPVESSSSIPVATTEAPPEPTSTTESSTYTVVAGDNMVSIARQHGTTSAILNKLNGLEKDGIIRPGQKLKIPASTTTTQTSTPETLPVTTEPEAPISNTIKHTVEDNETFYSIAKKYNVTIDALIKENPTVDPKTLRIGKIVQIPTKPKTTDLAPVSAHEPSPSLTSRSNIPVSNPSSLESQPRASDKPIKITKEISYSDFAKSYNTSTTRLDQINGLRLDPNTILAQGSELYIPEQP